MRGGDHGGRVAASSAPRRLAALVVATALAAGVLAGCGSSPAAPSRAAGSPPAATGEPLPTGAPPSPTALDGCITPEQATITYAAEPGGWLPIALLGTGHAVVVLSEQSDKLACDWLPFARRLTGSRLRVALYDFVGTEPPAAILRRVIGRVRELGADRVVLLGASQGAKASLIAAARTRPPVDGVISLSAEKTLGGLTVDDSVRRLQVPLLLVSSRDDPYGSADAARLFIRDAPVTDKRLVWVSGDAHGIDLLHGPGSASTVAAIEQFLAAHTR